MNENKLRESLLIGLFIGLCFMCYKQYEHNPYLVSKFSTFFKYATADLRELKYEEVKLPHPSEDIVRAMPIWGEFDQIIGASACVVWDSCVTFNSGEVIDNDKMNSAFEEVWDAINKINDKINNN